MGIAHYWLLIFIRCHYLDDAQTPPAVKRVCAAKNNAAMQIDKEEESKFDHTQNLVIFFSFNLDSTDLERWFHREEKLKPCCFETEVNMRLHDRFIVGGLRDKSNFRLSFFVFSCFLISL